MATINHIITKDGLSITVNEDKGMDKRTFEYVLNGVTKRHFLKGVGIDDQLGEFDIYNYVAYFDDQDNQIGNSENKNLRFTDSTYDIFYVIVENNISAIQAIHRRALNGLLEAEFGKGFYAFNPISDLIPIQPVEFTLSESTAPTYGNSDGVIGINHTDGSGTYDYSLDGITWDTISILSNLTAGEYQIYVRDQGVTNAWYRSKLITLVNA